MNGEEELVKKKKKKKKVLEADNEDECMNPKPKKKKKSSADLIQEAIDDMEPTESDANEDIQLSSSHKKKKKKKSKSEDRDSDGTLEETKADSNDVVPQGQEKKPKKKKRKKEKEDLNSPAEDKVGDTFHGDDESGDGSPSKKKKKKRKHQESADEDTGEAKKSGWDVKPAGHKDVERKSGWDVKGPVETGQWGAASLGSDERNDKFFRLMGGKKKGASGDTEGTFKQKFASQALNQSQEQDLNDGLEKQYQTAWETTRQKRGKGLGYDGTVASLENKKAFKKEGAETNSDSTTLETGQWGTASLGSDARNDKFFRLMGGKKKGATGDTEGTFKQKFASQALNQTEEQDLNAGLQKQYNDAWETTRQKRGLGLGYDENLDRGRKTFHIDTTSSNSTKLE